MIERNNPPISKEALLRLHDLNTSARNALSDGAALVTEALSPAARHIARRCANPSGSIELQAVLAGENGSLTCRFRVRYQGRDEPELSFWRLGGRKAPFAAQRVSRIRRDGALNEAVYSVSVPGGTLGFLVGAPAVGLLSVNRHELCRFERRRDELMVNPGIDKRYDHALATEASGKPGSYSLPASCAVEPPLFSIIVPLYRTPPEYFDAMVASVLAQTYGNWELVLVNASPDDEGLARALAALDARRDPRIVVVDLDENRGISLNTAAGIAIASGNYLSFLDHDDLLAPEALEAYAEEVCAHPDADLLYCDEDSVNEDGTICFEPRFKPDFNSDLLLTHNYVCHFLTVSRDAYERVEPYGRDVDGAQDYDLTLKVAEIARSIRHVPRVLYHWRQHEGSTNGGATEAKPYVVASSVNALQRHLGRRGIDAVVTPTDFSCVFAVTYPQSRSVDVSVLAAYRTDEELLGFLETLQTQRLSIVRDVIEAGPSDDFGAMINQAAARATGDYLLIADARVRFLAESDCVGSLRDVFCRVDVGIASAKAMAPDGHGLHAGLCVKDDGSVGYLNQGFTGHMGGGYHGLAECDCAYSAVGPFCFMVRTEDFRAVGGMDAGLVEPVAQTTDFSFKIRDLGKSVIVRPGALVEALMDPAEAELGASYLALGTADHEALWASRDEHFRQDVLGNPCVDFSTGYPRLRLPS